MSKKKDNIQLLDSSVIQQLRSSLVISSLTQCVKELVHNAIDANATNIEILIDADKFSLQVNDNGYGIQNLHKIGKRHVTSKCHKLSDINHIRSFGYRGEALAAIVNESLTQIISRYYQLNETYEGIWRDGRLIGEIGLSKHTQKSKPGTSVIVRDLFYKYPVRRRKAATEYQHVVVLESVKRLIMNFALCFHYLSFTLIDNNRNIKLLTIKKTDNSLETFKQLFGLDMAKHLKTLSIEDENIIVEGFISTQSYPNKSRQFIYLNNYVVPNDNELYKIVSEIFAASNFLHTKEKNEISPGRFIKKYPIYLIKFTCTEWSSYDLHMYLELFTQFSSFNTIVNLLKKYIHTLLKTLGYTVNETVQQNKGRKRSRAESSVFSSSQTKDPYLAHSPSVTSSIISHAKSHKSTSTHSVNTSNYVSWWNADTDTMLYIDPKTGFSYSADQLPQSQLSNPNTINRAHLKRAKLNHLPDTSEFKKRATRPSSSLFDSQLPAIGKPVKLSKEDLHHVKVLGQADKKFIILKLMDTQTIVMMDQHAADERVKLEEMIRNMKSVFTLEPSIPIQVNMQKFQLLTSKQITTYFRNWGIYFIPKTSASSSQQSRFFSTSDTSPHFEQKSSTTLYVTQLPKHIVDRSVMNPSILKAIICDHLYWIMEQTDEAIIHKTCPSGVMELLKSRACRSAIMFNDELTLSQCENLVQKLAKCNFPFQCAHGRPSAVPFNLDNHYLTTQKQTRKVNWSKFIIPHCT